MNVNFPEGVHRNAKVECCRSSTTTLSATSSLSGRGWRLLVNTVFALVTTRSSKVAELWRCTTRASR
eukprot:10191426-Prorocentrum_lima.AAC.1